MTRSLVQMALVTLAAVSAIVGAAVRGAQPILVQTATLAPFDLTRFGRPLLTTAAVTNALDHGLPFRDRPSFGSGLTWLGDDEFVGVTDRGPNDDDPQIVGHADGILFPLPGFTPSLVRFRWQGQDIAVSAIIPLHTQNGVGVTGLPNIEADGIGYDRPGSATPIPMDMNGLDIEGVRRLPDGRFLLVDEYGPSLVVASAGGEVLKRYLPPSRATHDNGFAVEGRVPEIFSQRRPNRGFESVAVSPDGRHAWTIMESPLGPRGDPLYGASRQVRILEWDLADALDARPVAEFLILLPPLAEVPTAAQQDDVKLSDAAWLSDKSLLVVEHAPHRVRLVLADLANATNVLGRREAETLAIDAVDAPLAEWGITPVATKVVFDSRDLPIVEQDKIEGLAVVNDHEVVISSDNDFGMGDNVAGAPAQLWRLRWPIASLESR